MMSSHVVWTALALLTVCALTPLTSCESDEDKPYKFGFNIEKYQHRLEEKDKKGIVKGEFGFVTGDGVYHETAYATDENGDFKILGMRSYFVGLREYTHSVGCAPSRAPPYSRVTPKTQVSV
ncbi:protein lethal(3)malignant blood neoplasm 1-like [Frankliniella occidentalis]|uniref:Protein lethal(3)malignant blood neoplasm 1-like n=1 Tax=Frankliniella occidentalis TaxID=133901 RepID=A0A9C6XUR6_FRAOC|nr:protein lethal(3)malignant blood neoplasm 1-like [Frankliniella occidentalis]